MVLYYHITVRKLSFLVNVFIYLSKNALSIKIATFMSFITNKFKIPGKFCTHSYTQSTSEIIYSCPFRPSIRIEHSTSHKQAEKKMQRKGRSYQSYSTSAKKEHQQQNASKFVESITRCNRNEHFQYDR